MELQQLFILGIPVEKPFELGTPVVSLYYKTEEPLAKVLFYCQRNEKRKRQKEEWKF